MQGDLNIIGLSPNRKIFPLESVKGQDISAELVRAIRKIALVRERLKAIDIQISDMKRTDLWMLKIKAEKAESQGRDLLNQMSTAIEGRIKVAQKEFDSLMKATA